MKNDWKIVYCVDCGEQLETPYYAMGSPYCFACYPEEREIIHYFEDKFKKDEK